MYKTLGDVGQALLGPIIIMFISAATALMCITTMESVLWSIFDSENDIRYDRIDTRPDTKRRSYSGPVQSIARMIRRRGFRYNKDKTERSLQDGMGPGSYEPLSEHTPLHISSGTKT